MTPTALMPLLVEHAQSQLADRYEALLRVSQAISAHRDPKDLFSTLAAELRKVIKFDFIGIAEYDQATGQGSWLLSECDHPCEDNDADCDPEQKLISWVYENQRPWVLPSLEHEAQFEELIQRLRQYRMQSACALPLTTAHRRIGILTLASEFANAYSDSEISFLSLIANQIAVAIDDALNFKASGLAQEALQRKREELQREKDRLRLLLDLNNSVVSNLDLRELLRAVSASVRQVMQCDVVTIDLPHPDGEQLQIYAIDFPESRGLLKEDSLIPLDSDAVPSVVFRTGKPMIVQLAHDPGISCEPHRMITGEGIQSGALLPLIGRHGVIGVLGLGARQENRFQQDDLDFLMQMAGQVSIALDNSLAYGQISDLRDQLAHEKLYLEDEIRSQMNFDEIVGNSAALRRVLELVETVAPTDSAVLILGETGTGKELIARAIHNHSARKERTFVKLNCATIPTGLLESELFGHEKGAFTGAVAQRIGRFELAHHGTMFLDEIGEVPLELQPKLLRVLQEREFERLGNPRTLRSDARLVAATNRDLSAMVEAQTFRADLFYRLNVFPIRVPALRERPEDIPILVRHFAQQFARRSNREIETIPSETMNALARYHWPGNIRELQNVIERAVILSKGPVLKIPLGELKTTRRADTPFPAQKDTLEEAERKHILSILESTKWVLGGPQGAALRLGMNRSTLQFRMKKLGIFRPAEA